MTPKSTTIDINSHNLNYTPMKDSVKLIVASILARVAREYNLHEIAEVASKYHNAGEHSNPTYNTLRNKAVESRITYNLIDLIDSFINK